MLNNYSFTDIVKIVSYSIITVGIFLTAFSSIAFIITYIKKNIFGYTICAYIMLILSGIVSLGLVAITQFNNTMKQLADSKVIPYSWYEITSN